MFKKILGLLGGKADEVDSYHKGVFEEETRNLLILLANLMKINNITQKDLESHSDELFERESAFRKSFADYLGSLDMRKALRMAKEIEGIMDTIQIAGISILMISGKDVSDRLPNIENPNKMFEELGNSSEAIERLVGAYADGVMKIHSIITK